MASTEDLVPGALGTAPPGCSGSPAEQPHGRAQRAQCSPTPPAASRHPPCSPSRIRSQQGATGAETSVPCVKRLPRTRKREPRQAGGCKHPIGAFEVRTPGGVERHRAFPDAGAAEYCGCACSSMSTAPSGTNAAPGGERCIGRRNAVQQLSPLSQNGGLGPGGCGSSSHPRSRR